MRTLIILAIGFAILAAALWAANALGGKRRAAMMFIGLWLVATLANLYVGTTHGYTVMEELPIFLLLFGLPAAAAIWLSRNQA